MVVADAVVDFAGEFLFPFRVTRVNPSSLLGWFSVSGFVLWVVWLVAVVVAVATAAAVIVVVDVVLVVF